MSTPTQPLPHRWNRQLLLLLALLLLGAAAFMSWQLQGNLSYALSRRGWMLLTMLLVGCAAGLSTVIFQTISANRILTPTVMGFDALYVLIQTLIMFTVGANHSLSQSPLMRFSISGSLMCLFAWLLYRRLLGGRQDLHRLLLVGLVFGMLFASLSQLLQRVIDPGEFDVLQSRLFARITLPDSRLIILSSMLIGTISIYLWRQRHCLDALALGREAAINLGINYQQQVSRMLIAVSVLVAISTALIGPLTFLGFVAATLSYQLMAKQTHAHLLLSAALIACLMLVIGQWLLTYGLNMAGVLTVVIELLGGGLFLLTLWRRGRL
ncbi:iron chelate uptake ABC transporter family permease subunit [Idiomarina xiamenensis]|uniref:Putative iron transport permease n=1 Tax=Idiomarina xiamenensis 10-D-4 TaxID=740709 RepID=K2KHD6_9GAMM|nr:iron chelate uptake ABC transporter family permease subunit [Idiomarina xiamenensis]EKE82079.1 putative iron transport permease [Idiomarina xiamenensis 10-D-4]